MTRPAVYRLLLVPLAAWMLHVAVGFSAVDLHCNRRSLSWTVAGVSGTRLVVVASVFLFAVLVAGAALVGERLRRAAREPGRDPTGGHGIVFAISVLSCLLVLLYLVWATVLTSPGPGFCT
jgi:hypothetical protein